MDSLFRDVLDAATLAARAHDRQPSAANAEKLDAAWRHILVLDRIALWRLASDHHGGADTQRIRRRLERRLSGDGNSQRDDSPRIRALSR
jgi:hypothetical protein